jgi:radical SAM superfamily enzyme YgiQ (UPF0313 family)
LLVAGGGGAALDYQFYLDKTPLDLVVLSEGEYSMLDLCNDKRWQDIDGIVFRKKARVLNGDDYWDINKDLDVEGMHMNKYWEKTASLYENPNLDEVKTFRLFTMNYCPLGCKFCTLTNWKKYAAGCNVPVVQLPPDQILYLVKRVVESYSDVRRIFFVDDDFYLVVKRGDDFCKLVIEEKEKGDLPDYLSFIGVMNIARINEKSLELMVKAGWKVLSIGVESTSQYVLNSLNKRQTVEQIWKATEMILKFGLKPYYTLLMFTPYGRIEDLLTDLQGFRKLSTMGAGISLEPYLIPLPGTPLWEERVPESTRWVDIEGTDVRIKKGFAWLPLDRGVREIFNKYEEIYPRFKAWRFSVDGVKHKEKNYQAGVMLDCLEFVLRHYFSYDVQNPRYLLKDLTRIGSELKKYDDYVAVDIVGDFVKAGEGM